MKRIAAAPFLILVVLVLIVSLRAAPAANLCLFQPLIVQLGLQNLLQARSFRTATASPTLDTTVHQLFPNVIVTPNLLNAATDSSYYYVLTPNGTRKWPERKDGAREAFRDGAVYSTVDTEHPLAPGYKTLHSSLHRWGR
jgi:hypothetical protein